MHNPKINPYPFDFRKPLPLIQDHRGCQIIPKDYFINKDLEYLKGGDLSRRYSTSVTKIKAATYDLKWIKDLIHELWSPVQVFPTMAAARRGRVRFIAACPYSTNIHKDIMKAQVWLFDTTGTSNLKFAMNGCIQIGTLDGANVEIRQEVREENFFLFGAEADEIVGLRKQRSEDK
ncbi:retrovirus-related pol polyprotein from transposon TNT 1-94, partial [Tanacetum coccineum]